MLFTWRDNVNPESLENEFRKNPINFVETKEALNTFKGILRYFTYAVDLEICPGFIDGRPVTHFLLPEHMWLRVVVESDDKSCRLENI